MMLERCPRMLDERAQELWTVATNIVELGGANDELTVLLAIDIRRQLRAESLINQLRQGIVDLLPHVRDHNDYTGAEHERYIRALINAKAALAEADPVQTRE